MLSDRAKVLLYSNNLAMLGEGLLGPLYAIFTENIGGNIMDITWAWVVYLLVTGITIIFVGAYCDRPKVKKRLLLIGFILNAIFTFLYLVVDSPLKLFIIEGGLGFAAALTIPTWYALYSKYQVEEESGWAWGLAQGQSKILLALAMVIGGAVVVYYSFTALFISMGIIQVIATVVLLGIFKKHKVEDTKKTEYRKK